MRALILCMMLVGVVYGYQPPVDLGVLRDIGDNYSFAVVSDTHIENESLWKYREVLSSAVRDNVSFIVVTGDIIADHLGELDKEGLDWNWGLFINTSIDYAINKDVPVIPVRGNHDRIVPKSERGMYVDDLNETFNEIVAIEHEYYSYDAGPYHFVVLPVVINETVLDWLREDLNSTTKPTVVFMHQHLLPLGLTQLDYYTYPPNKRKRIVNTLSRFGNVRYVISGHSHIGIKASTKVMWRYRNITYINIPSLVDSRPYGEEFDGLGNRVRGYLVVNVTEEELSFAYKSTVNNRTYSYNLSRAMQFNDSRYWFRPLEQFPVNARLRNGGFEHELKGWYIPYEYQEDIDPSNVIKRDNQTVLSGNYSVWLMSRGRGISGGGRPESVDLIQAVNTTNISRPSFVVWVNIADLNLSENNGVYIRFNAFNDTGHVFGMVYYIGSDDGMILNNSKDTFFRLYGYSRLKEGVWGVGKMLLDNNSIGGWKGVWRRLALNVSADYEFISGREIEQENVTRVVVWVGAVNDNHRGAQIKAWVDSVRLKEVTYNSNVDGKRIYVERVQ